jgi:formylglycine-generating enzyme required for sulfatase activity
MRKLLIFLLAMAAISAFAQIAKVTATPRWPWNGLVDITVSIPGGIVNQDRTGYFGVHLEGYDNDRGETIGIHTLSADGQAFVYLGDNHTIACVSGETRKFVWDASKDYPGFNTTSFIVKAEASAISMFDEYLVVNLAEDCFRTTSTAPDLSDDTCRTKELWLRWIPAGTFTMGSPEDELGRSSDEMQHEVTLTRGFYIGVFEMTQKQWELVMGNNPSDYKSDTRPVECVSYDDIRGTGLGAGWPTGGHAVDADSFLGRLRAKTGLLFDLPTEAQWEYACRAGTTTDLNSGKDITKTGKCPNMAEAGRYSYNGDDGKGGYGEHTKVGCYLPNAWGLYDMHGNVYEWCLDRYGAYPVVAVDPVGSASGSNRVCRGGCWGGGWDYLIAQAKNCRSAYRYHMSSPSDRNYYRGFRVVCCP